MKKTSNDGYYSLFIKWQESGLSKAAFAAEAGISRASFYYWCRKFEEQTIDPAVASGFSLINPAMGHEKDPIFKINYPSGISIEFFAKVDIHSLKEFL
jgi:hypothetical protein